MNLPAIRKHHAIAAILLGCVLSWTTGSSRGAGLYPTESACITAGQEMATAGKSVETKEAAEAKANPKIVRGTTVGSSVDWKCDCDSAKESKHN